MGQTHIFLETVHGAALDQEMHLCIWEAACKQARFFKDIAKAADYAASLSERQIDCYIGVGGFEVPPTKGRGKFDDVSYIAGVWLDIDIAGGSHAESKKSLPPTFEDGLAIVQAMGPEPSLLVRTGHGIHAWWLFKEPWIFSGKEDKAKAAILCKAWTDTARAVAAPYDVDPTGDITRVLRIPGTIHSKSGQLVEMVKQSDARYSAEDLEEYCIRPEFLPEAITKQRPHAVVLPLQLGKPAQVPQKVQVLIDGDDAFNRTWERKRRDIADKSGSGYDLAIANEGVYRGWTDQEIADAICANRIKHGDNPDKANRRDYLTRTIIKAREAIAGRMTESLPPDGVAPTDADKKLCMDSLKVTFGARFAGMRRILSEPPLYYFQFKNPDDEVLIGDTTKIANAPHVKKTLYGMRNSVTVGKVRDWSDVLRKLDFIREDVEDPVGSIEAQTIEMVRAYIRSYQPTTDIDFERSRPFLKDGYLHIYAQDLVRWLQTIQRLNCTVNEFRHGYLAKAGFISVQISNDAGTRRYYWRIPLSAMEEATTETTTMEGHRQ